MESKTEEEEEKGEEEREKERDGREGRKKREDTLFLIQIAILSYFTRRNYQFHVYLST